MTAPTEKKAAPGVVGQIFVARHNGIPCAKTGDVMHRLAMPERPMKNAFCADCGVVLGSVVWEATDK